jgi:hypothetical protein
MADGLDQSPGSATDASEAAATPVAPAIPDLETTILQPLVKKFDERFSGFQSIYDQKLAGITRAISDLKTAGLSPEEQEQVANETAMAENQRLAAENALLRAAQEGPEAARAVAVFQKITGAQTLEEQLAVIRAEYGPKAADQAEQAAATAAAESAQEATSTAAPPSGNPNNPARTKAATLAGYNDGDPMTAELAAAIMNAASDKGALFKARQG